MINVQTALRVTKDSRINLSVIHNCDRAIINLMSNFRFYQSQLN